MYQGHKIAINKVFYQSTFNTTYEPFTPNHLG